MGRPLIAKTQGWQQETRQQIQLSQQQVVSRGPHSFTKSIALFLSSTSSFLNRGSFSISLKQPPPDDGVKNQKRISVILSPHKKAPSEGALKSYVLFRV
jgi:hypothetical protein